jgi:murein DD-endopeptidase MepM/ murein hydrolase activator NlpD
LAYDPRKLVARRVSPSRTISMIAIFALIAAALAAGYFAYRWWRGDGKRNAMVWEFLDDPGAHAEWVTRANSRCEGAPFTFPTDGYIGYLYGDSFRPWQKHQGIDVFGDQPIGKTPVYAAYDGFLTRLADWKSAVIIRVPSDPLSPGREIWLYYAHMAGPEGNSFIDAEFPPGTMDKPVKMGQPLGFQGNYSGDPAKPTGVHLHFSIVRSDGKGGFRNETDIANTLDPSPYFGMGLNAESGRYGAPQCVSPIDPGGL